LIPFFDLKSLNYEIKEEIKQAISRVINSGHYIGGDEVESFESEFASYCNVNECIGVGNGYDALHLSLRALGVKQGDEVIVPSNTYIATWLAVSNCGARPVPVEPDPKTYNIDPSKIECKITSKTKVIIPVHLYGLPADIDEIINLAKRYHIYILEDAAQAHGAVYKGRRIGCHGDAIAWSFYPSKNLGAMGDAGAVTTHDRNIAERIRLLRNYGSNSRYMNDIKGFNSRIDPIQAAILKVKLKHLDKWNSRRAYIASYYSTQLFGTEIETPFIPSWAESAWHLYVIRYSKRDYLQKKLLDEGIETLIHYPVPPHLQKAYSNDIPIINTDLKITSELSQQIISLPIWPHLNEDQLNFITKTIKNTIIT